MTEPIECYVREGHARRRGNLPNRSRWARGFAAATLVLSLPGVGPPSLPRASATAWAAEAAAGIGEPAPDFSLPSATGGEVSLGIFRAKRAVVLVFYMGQR
jgi:hypothetical protein